MLDYWGHDTLPGYGRHPKGAAVPEAIDPVCGMTVDTDNPPGGSYNYEDTTYYFCAPGCREDFIEDPTAYLSDVT